MTYREGQVNSTSVIYNKKSLTFKGLTTVTMSVCFIHFAISGQEDQLRGQGLGSQCGKLLINSSPAALLSKKDLLQLLLFPLLLIKLIHGLVFISALGLGSFLPQVHMSPLMQLHSGIIHLKLNLKLMVIPTLNRLKWKLHFNMNLIMKTATVN